MRLQRDFYLTDAYNLAQNLLGKVLCLDNKSFRIVETESYGGAYDRACHAYNYRRTERTKPLYLIGGCLYIYLIYGMYYMLNITANLDSVPEAVLIRAVEPLSFCEGKTDGPGKLCKTLNIDKRFNSLDLVESENMYIIDDGYFVKDIVETKRINIDYALEDKDRLWRFYIKDNPYISKR
jgi:DNA-3-methyladenine glycosylase